MTMSNDQRIRPHELPLLVIPWRRRAAVSDVDSDRAVGLDHLAIWMVSGAVLVGDAGVSRC